jgi:hypothetical protein
MCTLYFFNQMGVDRRDLMIDLETMGRTADAVVTEIAMAIFDHRGSPEATATLYLGVEAAGQMANGRRVDGETLDWWLKTPRPPRRGIEMVNFDDARIRVHNFLKANVNKGSTIWANSPSFDCRILRHFMAPLSYWEFWQERDVRTVKSLIPRGKAPAAPKDAHSALADVHYQIDLINYYFKNHHK